VPDEITPTKAGHNRWVETSHQLLGLPTPPLPAFDYIGHIIFWDQQAARAMAAKIESTTGLEWVEALCITREFSEYLLYGYFVQSDARFASRHTLASSTPCVSYWEPSKLGWDELNQLLRRADKDDVAFSVASFSGTPVETIRAVLADNAGAGAPRFICEQTEGLVALC
jgi:hypothetical protein